MTKRERIDRDVLHRRAQVVGAVRFGAGDDVRDLMAAAAPSHVPRTQGKHVLRAAPDLAEAGGEDGPRGGPSHAPRSAGCGPTPPDYPTGSPADDRTRGPRRPPVSHLRGQRWLQFWLQLR